MIALASVCTAFASVFNSPLPVHPPLTVQYGETPIEDTGWSNPSVLSTKVQPRGRIFAAESFYYGEYRKRKLELSELMVGYGVTHDVSVWAARQKVLLKGRSGGRYRNSSNNFGFKYVIRAQNEGHANGLAIDIEHVAPDDATATSGGSEITYPAVKVNTLALTASTKKGLLGQISYSNVDAEGNTRGDVFGFTVGQDYTSGRLRYQLQAQAIGQHIANSLENVGLEVKPVFFGAVSYRLANSLRLESDLTFMPSGTPLYSGRLTSLSAFQIYRPTGPAADLRRDAFGYGSIRLMYHKSL